MNRKQLILVLAILVLLGGAGMVLVKRNKESWSQPDTRMGEKVLPDFPYNDVAAIHVKGDAELNVVRQNGLWRVRERSDYPANIHLISDLLLKIKNLKVVQSETVSPSQLAQVNLLEPGNGAGSGTLVEFKDAQGKVLAALLLGKVHMPEQGNLSPLRAGTADGRYILLRNDPKDVLLISESLGSLVPMPEHWLSRDFIKVEKEKVKSYSMTSTNAAGSWKISRETESSPWVLADSKPGEVLDDHKVSAAVSMLSAPSFTDVVLHADPAATGLDKPTLVTIETFDHFTYTLKIGDTNVEGSCYVRVGVAADIQAGDKAKELQEKFKQEQTLEPWVYLVGSWILEPAVRDRMQIMVGKQEEPADAASTGPVMLAPGVNPGVVK